jgi:hypothetical protein
MGILYTVWPLDSQAREWLQSQNIAFPATPSRWPTRGEVRAVLEDLKGFKVKYTENGPGRRWDAFLSDGEDDGNWTLLQAEPQGDNDDVTQIHFEKGEPTLIVAVLRALAAVTGPFMLLPDIGCPPMVVSTSRSVSEIVANHCTIDITSKKWQVLVSGAQGAGPASDT